MGGKMKDRLSKNKIMKKTDRILTKLKKGLMLDELKNNNKGMGVIEVILIILVLVGLVVIFRTNITNIVNTIFNKITTKVNTF